MRKASILVAEDNVDVLDSLRRLLELEGFSVITADNCSTALEQISQFKPNVILTDLGMPGMTGLEFIYTLRRTSSVAHVPIIAISAHSKKYLSAALDAGADIALHKLEGFDTLLEAINRLLGGSGPSKEVAMFH
ncbi:MAG TPA: response regulator [Blastocatellia bacterium]|nr:response regulator [Blastocatellia bacterium]